METDRETLAPRESSMMLRLILAFLAGLRFLTVLPVAWRAERDSEYLRPSLFFFPLIGLLIGCGAAGTAMVLGRFLPFQLVVILAVVLLISISGGLHMDGLADSCDGLFSSRKQERMLVIMRDSRIGTMGVLAIVAVFGIKVAALGSLEPSLFWPALVLMPLAGRVAMLIMMSLLSYMRGEDGIGTLFQSQDRGEVRGAAITGLLLFIPCLSFLSGGHLVGAVCGVVVLVLLFGRLCRIRLGGYTGDTLGAVCELSETVVAVSMAVSW